MSIPQPQNFSCFGNPKPLPGYIVKPESRDYFKSGFKYEGFIPRGSGLSLSDASYGTNVTSIDLKAYDKIISFDHEKMVIEIEAGMTLGKLSNFLLSKDLYLSIMPGHPDITVGGCIASNAHGKNQFKDGCFYTLVEELLIYQQDQGFVNCKKGELLFELTCGGFGLTGIISRVTLNLHKLPAKSFSIDIVDCNSIFDVEDILLSHSNKTDILYSWHDLVSNTNGKGFVYTGQFNNDSKIIHREELQTSYPPDIMKKMPCFYNSTTTREINKYFYNSHTKNNKRNQSILETFFPIQKKMIYYYLFGNRGVIENQWLFSHEQWKNFLNDFLKLCDSSKNPLTLVSTKLFNGESKYLRFDGTGICLAINTPNTEEGLKFSKSMDELGLKFKGIPNIIKDIRIQHDVIEKAYGSEYLRFKNELNDVIPESKIRSSLSDRLHL